MTAEIFSAEARTVKTLDLIVDYVFQLEACVNT